MQQASESLDLKPVFGLFPVENITDCGQVSFPIGRIMQNLVLRCLYQLGWNFAQR